MTRAVALLATLYVGIVLMNSASARATSEMAISASVAWELAMLGLPAALLFGWLRSRRGRLCETLMRLRARHAGLIASALRMREAGGLIPLLAGNGPHVRALNRRFREVIDEANQLSALLDEAEEELGRWHLARARRGLGDLEARVTAFERRVAEVESALRGLNADTHECVRHLGVARALHGEIAGLLGKRDWGWDQDVRDAMARIEARITEAERLRDAGDPVEALRLARGSHAALQAQKQVLEARQASLTWLENAPAEARRLEGEERRLTQAGFRHLPHVDVAGIRRMAEAAIRDLGAGRLGEATARQQALRHELKALRAGLIGREELHLANSRQLTALRVELAAIEAQLGAVHEADCRARYPERLWRGASTLRRELEGDLGAVRSRLRAAEAANGMEVQDFQRAHDELRQARALAQELREAVARCQTMWLALPRQERLLKDRTLTLMGRAAEAKAEARTLGLAVDPRLMAMIEEVKAAMSARPLDLEAAGRAIAAAETSLERFETRLASLEARLERHGAHRPGAVTLVRVEKMFETEEPEGRRR